MNYFIYVVILLSIFFVPNITNAETPVKVKKDTPSEIVLEWKKLDDGIYNFSFKSDISKVDQNEKTNAFLKELSIFKADHSNELIIGYQPIFDTKNNISGYIVSTQGKGINGTVTAAIITSLIGLSTLFYSVRHNRKTLFPQVNRLLAQVMPSWLIQLRDQIPPHRRICVAECDSPEAAQNRTSPSLRR